MATSPLQHGITNGDFCSVRDANALWINTIQTVLFYFTMSFYDALEGLILVREF